MTSQEIRELQQDLRTCEGQLSAAEDHRDTRHYKNWLKLRDDIARRLEAEFKEDK